MTTKLPFTQAGIRRAIAAARAAGLRVVAIRPDGTLIVNAAIGGEWDDDTSEWSNPRA